MLCLALVAALAISAEAPAAAPRWAEPPETVGHLAAFVVRVQLHAKLEELAGITQNAIQSQIDDTLRTRRIAIATGTPESPHDVGYVILDVHVIAAGPGTSVAWSLHASQLVQLHSGAAAFASTWEVGDLLHGPAEQIASQLRKSLQPALEELCDAYDASRLPTPPPPKRREVPRAADL
jgi:hypothetical protein